MIPENQSSQSEVEEAHLAQKDIGDLISNAASVHPGFQYTPGVQPIQPPEFKAGELASAVYESSGYGLAHRITEDTIRDNTAVPGYNFIENVDEEFLNDQDIWYFVNDVNPAQTKVNNQKLRREKNAAQGMDNYPWRYGAAFIAEGVIDPINWAFPGAKIAVETKKAYSLAKAGKAALSAKSLALVGAESTLLGAASGLTQEALIHQTQLTRDLQDSVYSVMASAGMSGLLGTAIPAGISGYHYAKASSQLGNIMAGNTPTPTRAPQSHVFAMMPEERAAMKGDDVIASLPEVTKKMMNISNAGRLRNSKSVSANAAATDLATTSLLLNKNVEKNKATQIAVDEHITQLRGKARATSIDVNKIFMEQQGVSGNFAGIRSRIKEAQGVGLGRKDFSEKMFFSMESGLSSGNSAVDSAVSRVKKYLTETKLELVQMGRLDKKFLDPEFDNYFTHHWLEKEIFRNHEGFKLLAFKWYDETNKYYQANQTILRPLVDKMEFSQRELDKANRNLSRVLNSKEYKAFQETKNVGLEKAKEARKTALGARKKLNEEVKVLRKEITGLKKNPKEIKKLEKTQKRLDEILLGRENLEADLGLIKSERKGIKATRFKRVIELEERLDKFKKLTEQRKEKLYSKIDPKYLTPGGWVPLGNKTPLELHAAAMQTFYRTTGSDVSSFLNPMTGGGAGGNPDPLQARLLTMPHDYTITKFDGSTITASDFLSKDIWRMLDNYAGATASTMAFDRIARSRGFKDPAELKEWYLKNIEADYDEMLQGKSGKEALKIGQQKKKDLRNLTGLWDQQHNIAGKSLDLWGTDFARFMRRLREYNSQRMLGSAALSSLTDPFMVPFRQGPFTWMQEWLIPFAKQLGGRNQAIKRNINDINDAGFALETQAGMIAKKFYDNDDLLIEQKWWHNTAEFFTTSFGNITFLSQIGDFTKAVGGHVSISRTIRQLVNKIENGKVSEKGRKRLRKVGISESSERVIYDMWKEKGGIDRGAYYSNHTEWNINSDQRAIAYAEFTNSWQRDVTHGNLRSSVAEQPEFYNSTLGKALFHFKDYMLAANEKILLSGIQKIGQREYEVLISTMMLMGMGSITYILNSLAKDPTGESLDLSAGKLFREGMDRGAILGIWAEPINMFQKQGWLPGQSVSRYQSRGILGNWVGPEIGTAQDLANAIGNPIVRKIKGEGNYTTKDALQILRLIPLQNLFYLRYLNEQVTKKTAESLGATPKE